MFTCRHDVGFRWRSCKAEPGVITGNNAKDGKMTHLLHEVKEELDWTTRELVEVEAQLAALEKQLRDKVATLDDATERDAFIANIEDQKNALNLNDLYSIMSRAARRFSLLTRVFEIGARHGDIDDIVTALTDGQLFRLDDTSEETDRTIIEVAEALQTYFHGHFDDDADQQLRGAWLHIEDALRALGRNI